MNNYNNLHNIIYMNFLVIKHPPHFHPYENLYEHQYRYEDDNLDEH